MRTFISLILFSFVCLISARIKDRYCGDNNCYTLLNVKEDASPTEIKKAYRTQSLKYHPDKNPGRDTTPIYRDINKAYEVLSNEDLRATYDRYLENPNASEFSQYYEYYKAVYAPKTDPKFVFALIFGLVSVFQYFTRSYMYQNTLKRIQKTTKFQTTVNQRFEEEKALKSDMTKEDIIKEILETVKVHGGYAAPKFKELLAIKTLLLPYTILKYIYDQIRWVVLFWILKKPYGDKEKEYLTRTRLGMKQSRWDMLEEEERQEFLQHEIWIPENLIKYQKEAEEKRKEMMANNTKYKQYQRFLKKKNK